MRTRISVPALLLTVGLALAALQLLDPRLQPHPGIAVVVPGAILLAALVRRWSPIAVLALVAILLLAVGAWVQPSFRADSASYYAYLRSLSFDGDVDFSNEWERWGYPPLPLSPTGLPINDHTVGAALMWSPFFAIAHLYVKSLRFIGDATYAADGFSVPYVRSAALGTVVWTVVGLGLLYRAMRPWIDPKILCASIAGVFLASPWVYYCVRMPLMAHGLSIAAGAACILAWMYVRARGSVGAWSVLGLSVGLLGLLRPQNGVVAALLVVPLAWSQWRARRIRWSMLVAFAASAVLVFLPQMFVWRSLYGRFLTMPQTIVMDWRSPSLVNVLVSSDRGFLTWTPIAIAGLCGLILSMKGDRRVFACGALLAIAAAAWINGSVTGIRQPEWAGSDAFGARRFDAIFPMLVFGVAAFLKIVVERPFGLALVFLLLTVIWNIGLAASYEAGVFSNQPPTFERVAAAQARELRGATQRLLTGVYPGGRALAYKIFVGEYFYYNIALDGMIDLGSDSSERFLRGGWSEVKRKGEDVVFRWALGPRSCVVVPLETSRILEARIRLRRAPGVRFDFLNLTLNDDAVATVPLSKEWVEVSRMLPLRGGENYVCLSSPETGNETASAAVAYFKLP